MIEQPARDYLPRAVNVVAWFLLPLRPAPVSSSFMLGTGEFYFHHYFCSELDHGHGYGKDGQPKGIRFH